MSTPAAIGFRAHSGWAAAVAIAGPVDAPSVIARRRVEMVDRGAADGKQPYHAAVGLGIREAQQIVTASAARAASLAAAALRGIVEDLRKLGHEVAGCGLLLASGRPLPALASILASHALIHTAEGELFREALRAASRACGLPLVEVKERELLTRAKPLEPHLAAMGRAIGPPWRQDQKYATMAAWLALSEPRP
ncbi:MAG: hypothetical protein ABSH32_31715 [Bryobacteraceae bacterium]|jgi:hypothetical protein